MKLIKGILKTKERLMLAAISLVILLLLFFLSTPACSATFKGKVIDADTKQPIEGAVIVASWNEERATLTDGGTRFKDVKEILTDKNGEWEIKGPRGWIRGNFISLVSFFTRIYITRPPEFIIFKPGYCSWPKGFGIEACREKIKPESFRQVAEDIPIELTKLTNREDRLKALPGPVAGGNALKKQKEFIRLINEESKYLNIPEAYH